jgi:dethiobiotin synthetase
MIISDSSTANGCFVTGTDTGIGKTVISTMILLASGGRYWKPVQSGSLDETDSDVVRKLTGLDARHFVRESYKLSQPLSPHIASRMDHVKIQMNRMMDDFNQIMDTSNSEKSLSTHNADRAAKNFLVVEGAGGLLVPLNPLHLMIDFIQMTRLPVVLVCRSTLGTINHSLLSIEALRNRNISICGVVMNGEENPDNRRSIEDYGKVKVLTEVPQMKKLLKKDLLNAGIKIINAAYPGYKV